MRSLWLLFVVVSAAFAAQVANPVYRAQPTIMMAKSANNNVNNPLNTNQPTAPVQAEAEERESQAFPNSDNAKAVNSVVNPSMAATSYSNMPTQTVVQPATLMQPASLVQTSSVLQPTSSHSTLTADPQQYQVYMMNPVAKPLTTPVANPYTSYTQQAYDGQYNPLQYQQQVTAPSDGLLNNIPWKDVLVGLSSLALLGLGASLAYPALKGLRSRALRELQDIKADDAARMAKSVMKAIRKFSEINQQA